MSTENQIDKYFINADIPLLLYSICASEINTHVTDQHNVVLFQFDNYPDFIDWLEIGGTKPRIEVSFIGVPTMINHIPQKHIMTMMEATKGPNRICLIVVCEDGQSLIWCSATTLVKITHLSLFNEVRSRYPKHLKMEEYVYQTKEKIIGEMRLSRP